MHMEIPGLFRVPAKILSWDGFTGPCMILGSLECIVLHVS